MSVKTNGNNVLDRYTSVFNGSRLRRETAGWSEMMLKTMRTTVAAVTAATMLAASSIVAVPAAQAEPGFYGAQVIQVRDRGNKNWKYKKYNNRYHGGHRHRHYHNHNNGIPGGLLFGLAAGAIVGSALSQPHYNGVRDWDAYCSRKFKTYKPWTGTYTGYDGRQHRCP